MQHSQIFTLNSRINSQLYNLESKIITEQIKNSYIQPHQLQLSRCLVQSRSLTPVYTTILKPQTQNLLFTNNFYSPVRNSLYQLPIIQPQLINSRISIVRSVSQTQMSPYFQPLTPYRQFNPSISYIRSSSVEIQPTRFSAEPRSFSVSRLAQSKLYQDHENPIKIHPKINIARSNSGSHYYYGLLSPIKQSVTQPFLFPKIAYRQIQNKNKIISENVPIKNSNPVVFPLFNLLKNQMRPRKKNISHVLSTPNVKTVFTPILQSKSLFRPNYTETETQNQDTCRRVRFSELMDKDKKETVQSPQRNSSIKKSPFKSTQRKRRISSEISKLLEECQTASFNSQSPPVQTQKTNEQKTEQEQITMISEHVRSIPPLIYHEPQKSQEYQQKASVELVDSATQMEEQKNVETDTVKDSIFDRYKGNIQQLKPQNSLNNKLPPKRQSKYKDIQKETIDKKCPSIKQTQTQASPIKQNPHAISPCFKNSTEYFRCESKKGNKQIQNFNKKDPKQQSSTINSSSMMVQKQQIKETKIVYAELKRKRTFNARNSSKQRVNSKSKDRFNQQSSKIRL